MTLFRTFLITSFVAIFSYTAFTIVTYGINIAPIFFGDIASLTWRGQFAFDFLTYLWLSGLWVAWRGGFTGGSIAHGVTASILGMVVFAPYLLFLLNRTGGDMRVLLLGVHAKT